MNNNIINSSAIFLQLILTTVLISAQPVLSQSQQSIDIDSFKTTVDSVLEEKKIPGAGIALVHKDSVIWSGGIGYAKFDQKTSVTSDHLFRIGSVSKTFIALGIMKLVQEQKLSLDAEVQKLVPEIEIKNLWSETDPIQVKHLLEHTAGFDDMHFSETYNTQDDPAISLKKAINIIPASKEVRWKPGTRFSYSNPGYAVAGYIIEKITGQKYEKYLKEEILKPIGMSQSSFLYTDSVESQLVLGYQGYYDPVEYQHIYLRPAGSLHSSAKDMAKFVRMMLNKGSISGQTIIADSLFNRMETPTTTLAAKKGLENGYGLGILRGEIEGHQYFGHDGAINGFSSRYMYFPEYDLGLAILVNKMTSLSDLTKEVTKLLLKEYSKLSPTPTIELTEDQLNKYEGYYEHESIRNELAEPFSTIFRGVTLSVSNDTLYAKEFMGSPEPLLPIGKQKFRSENNRLATTILMDTEEYGSVMRYNEGFYVKTGSWKKYVYRSAFLGGLGILSIFLLFSLGWIPFEGYRKYSSQYSPFPYQPLFWWPFSAICSIILLMFAASQLDLMTIGEPTVPNVLITVATYLFGICSLGSLWTSIKSWKKDISIGYKVFFSLTSATLFGFTLFLIYWDLMGIMFWAY
ncbi:MAG: serine hydrolase domain-containing protein [Balneolaceae bacterium]|nr:serine hydrolase domain-containing protein [Balneolaceae bacterium]